MTTSRSDGRVGDEGPRDWSQLTVRTRRTLEKAGIDSVVALCGYTTLGLWSLKGFGGKAYLECLLLLGNHNLVLKTENPEFDFRPAAEALKRHIEGKKPFQRVGEKLGISSQLAYELHVLLEKAASAGDLAKREHIRWVKQMERFK